MLAHPAYMVEAYGHLLNRFLDDGSSRKGILNQILDSWLAQPVGVNRGEPEALAALVNASTNSPARLMLIDGLVSERLMIQMSCSINAAVHVAACYMDIYPGGQSLASNLSAALLHTSDPTTLHQVPQSTCFSAVQQFSSSLVCGAGTLSIAREGAFVCTARRILRPRRYDLFMCVLLVSGCGLVCACKSEARSTPVHARAWTSKY